MARTALATAVALLALVSANAPGAAPARPATPEVAIFYYAWYGTPRLDGDWLHWDQHGNHPPGRIASRYYPSRGPYSSSDRGVLRGHMREIAAAGVDTVVVSWWGPGSVEDRRLRPVATAARAAGLRVAVHVEPWPGRTAAGVAEALRGLRGLGIADAYVYDSVFVDDAEWATALAGLGGMRVFANTGLPGKALRGGFDGLYTYDALVYDGTSFPRMCKSARTLGLVCAPSVGPGFDATRATSIATVRPRRAGGWYDRMWRSAIRARADVVTITSYNEWHEGTQIEPARSGVPSYASYEGAWGLTGKRAERSYLDRTRHWVDTARAARPSRPTGSG